MEYWESKFNTEGAMWHFEPSDASGLALELFKDHGIHAILLPGYGYGRNAKLFEDKGIEVTGIEISAAAIAIARANGLKGNIHHGSVTEMPFDDLKFGGIFCYALLHLLTRPQRKKFIQACFNQLESGGIMIFTVASKQMSYYGSGRILSKDRFRIMNGLNVYFYDTISLQKEFAGCGIVEIRAIDEPIKFMPDSDPLKLLLVICRKP